MKTIQMGIGFTTGRMSFRKVLNAYIKNWQEAKKKLPADYNISLNLFVAYDTDYLKTKSTDYTNLQQDIVDEFDQIVFLGAKNSLKNIERLEEHSLLDSEKLSSVFSTGYAGKRNAILFAALENHMDYLLFLDDDEYPLAVTKSKDVCLWSGQHIILSHLMQIPNADYTNGLHCGYVSPIPQIPFSEDFTEQDFKAFIEAISNDIINWESMRQLMRSGGVTYASTDVLMKNQPVEVREINCCKFISGANLCINLTKPERTFPFFNPPGARGEDTFLSTMLHDRTVLEIPFYAFHDGFSSYKNLLSGVLPTELTPITADSPAIISRFLSACIGWVRYKPLLIYITNPGGFDEQIAKMRITLAEVAPKLAQYFRNSGFLKIIDELEEYQANAKQHAAQFQLAQETWLKLVQKVILRN